MELLQSTVMAKQKRSKKPLLAIVIFLIALVLAGFAGFKYYNVWRQQKLVRLLPQIVSLNSQKRYDTAHRLLRDQKKLPFNTREEKIKLYLAAASVYYNQGKWQDGIDEIKQIDKLGGMTAQSASTLGDGYASLGDKDNATSAYTKSIELWRQSSSPLSAAEIRTLEAIILGLRE